MKPSYRVVVTDSHSPRDGAFIEIIGHFNPRTNPETVVTKTGIMDKFKASKGADKEKT
jgi:small subunit ribosomal protein S16